MMHEALLLLLAPQEWVDSDSLDGDIGQHLLAGAMARAVKNLTDREREIIERHWGLLGGEPETHAEIAKDLAISMPRVWQVEQKALRKLQASPELADFVDNAVERQRLIDMRAGRTAVVAKVHPATKAPPATKAQIRAALRAKSKDASRHFQASTRLCLRCEETWIVVNSWNGNHYNTCQACAHKLDQAIERYNAGLFSFR